MKRFLAAAAALLGTVSVLAQSPGAAGVWTGSVQIANQNGAAIPLSKITSSGEEISFSIGWPQGDVVFKGTLSPDHSAIEGDFTQDMMLPDPKQAPLARIRPVSGLSSLAQ